MPKKILLVEDNEEHVIIARKVLKKIKTVEVIDEAKDITKALEQLSQKNYDVIVCDYLLGNETAKDLLEELKKRNIFTPFVVVTAEGSEKIAVDLMKAGAADYVPKDEQFPNVLEIVLKHVIERHRARISSLELKAELQEKNEFINKALDSLAYPFYVVDKNFTIQLVNEAGRKKGITVGSKCHKMTHGLDEPCASEKDKCPLVEVIKSKKPIILEHIHFDQKGEERYVEVHGDPILDKQGNVQHMIEYSIDITDRKLMEEELKRKLYELEVFNKSAVNREVKMIELKKKIVELENKLKGQ